MKSDTTTYAGVRSPSRETKVTVDGEPLPLRLDLRNHSPSFDFGYYGSGPAQLSLAILADFLEQGPFVDRIGIELPPALRLYQDFKWEVVSKIETDRWEIKGRRVRLWVEWKIAQTM